MVQMSEVEQDLLIDTIVQHIKDNAHVKEVKNTQAFFILVSETLKANYEMDYAPRYLEQQYRKLKQEATKKYGKDADVEAHLKKIGEAGKQGAEAGSSRRAGDSEDKEVEDTVMGEASDNAGGGDGQGMQQAQ